MRRIHDEARSPSDLLRPKALRKIRRRIAAALRLTREAETIPNLDDTWRTRINEKVTAALHAAKGARAAMDEDDGEDRYDWFMEEASRHLRHGSDLLSSAKNSRTGKRSGDPMTRRIRILMGKRKVNTESFKVFLNDSEEERQDHLKVLTRSELARFGRTPVEGKCVVNYNDDDARCSRKGDVKESDDSVSREYGIDSFEAIYNEAPLILDIVDQTAPIG